MKTDRIGTANAPKVACVVCVILTACASGQNDNEFDAMVTPMVTQGVSDAAGSQVQSSSDAMAGSDGGAEPLRPVDASAVGSDGAFGAVDAPTGAVDASTDSGMACGIETCVGSDVCCYCPQIGTEACTSSAQCLTESLCGGVQEHGVPLLCENGTGCDAGTVCCASIDQSGSDTADEVASVGCAPAANCILGFDIVLCDPSDPNACASSPPITTCQSAESIVVPAIPPGLYGCYF